MVPMSYSGSLVAIQVISPGYDKTTTFTENQLPVSFLFITWMFLIFHTRAETPPTAKLSCLISVKNIWVKTVACKRSWSFYQKCAGGRLQHAPYLCGFAWSDKVHGCNLYGVHRMCWDGSSFIWHHPCKCCKYSTLVDIYNKKRAFSKKIVM